MGCAPIRHSLRKGSANSRGGLAAAVFLRVSLFLAFSVKEANEPLLDWKKVLLAGTGKGRT